MTQMIFSIGMDHLIIHSSYVLLSLRDFMKYFTDEVCQITGKTLKPIPNL